jgi:hypothetical protein
LSNALSQGIKYSAEELAKHEAVKMFSTLKAVQRLPKAEVAVLTFQTDTRFAAL